MKVLMLSWEFRPHVIGGLGKAVTELVPALVAAGIDVHLVTPQIGDAPDLERMDAESAEAGTLVVYRVRPPTPDVYDIYTLAERTNRALQEQARRVIDELGGVDLVHVHDWLVAFAGIALKHAYKVPLLATIHATEYGRHRGNISGNMSRAIHNVEWWLSYEAWRIICCSRFMATEVGAAFRAPPDKVDVIPNGIDSTPFDALEGVDLRKFRAAYAAPDEPILLCVGRVVYEKGAHLLVEAFPRILAEFPKAKLVITGEGPHLPAVRDRVDELGIGDRVCFTGFVPIEVRNKLYRVADVAVFPSLYEPFGIVALEAMVAKAPVVVADVGGLSEVVTHAETGILVHPSDAESLARGVLHTLQRPAWARQRAATAYRVAVEEYSWQAVARRTIQVYERIVAERRNTAW